MGKLMVCAEKYKYVLPVLILGVILMLFPRQQSRENNRNDGKSSGETYSLTEVQEKMEDTLGHIEGVGQVKVMLSLKSGSTLQLAENRASSQRDTENKQDSEIVKLNRGSGTQDVVVTEQVYPTYQGAVIVCQGADDPAVCLSVTEAVAVLTGLGSEKITVVKWND